MPFGGGEFFYFGICHSCKNECDNLKRCGSCRTVAYCSKEHQTLDWSSHKRLCKAISLTNKEQTDIKNFSFEDWKNYRISCQDAWVSFLKRDLKPYECQMWMFPRVCNVCYTKENLTDCVNCRNVAYCCEEHKERDKSMHELYCKELKLCLEVDRYLAKNNSYPQIELKENTFAEKFPDDIEKLLDLIEKEKKCQDQVSERVLKVDAMAPGAIILYALKISGVTQFLRDKLILHVVGSSSAEGTADWRIATELILHWIPDMRRITYIFIGPEAWNISACEFNLCQTCKDNKKTLEVKVCKQLYHEVIDDIEDPNLIVSFNSGLHEFEGQKCDQWQKSIPMLIRSNRIPLIFTSYTEEEMLRDLQRIRDIFDTNLQILMCGKNPYASLRPIRDWCTKDIPIFYSNGYISIVKKK